jgi:hypothetical protein
MTGQDAMFDAMQHVEGTAPNDRSRLNRNPLNLRASSIPHTFDSGGLCVFPDIIEGTRAGMLEIACKVTGNNSHGITPDSTLDQLFDVYAPRGDGDNDPNRYALAVAAWCSKALGREISHATALRVICPELISQEVKS